MLAIVASTGKRNFLSNVFSYVYLIIERTTYICMHHVSEVKVTSQHNKVNVFSKDQ